MKIPNDDRDEHSSVKGKELPEWVSEYGGRMELLFGQTGDMAYASDIVPIRN